MSFATRRRPKRRGLSLVEMLIALAMIGMLVSVLLPVLSSARRSSWNDLCITHQRVIGQAWITFLNEQGQFPTVVDQPAWRWGGVRFPTSAGQPWLDFNRPLNRYLPLDMEPQIPRHQLFQCPGDKGLPALTGGGRSRTAFEAFGTSYRANVSLLHAPTVAPGAPPRPLRADEIGVRPADVVLFGDAPWFGAMVAPDRQVHWHGRDGGCNLCFLDGSVRRVIPGAPPFPRPEGAAASTGPVDPADAP